MGHQLYCLQTLMLNMYETRMNTPADPDDPVSILNKIVWKIEKIIFKTYGRIWVNEKKIYPIYMYSLFGYLFWSKIKVFLLFQNVQKQIDSLTKICFDVDNETAQSGNRKSTLYRKLGFQVQQSLVLTSLIYHNICSF